MHRVVIILLILATPMITGAADISSAFTDLRNEMSAAETLPEQRVIVERMRQALRVGAVPTGQVSVTIYGLSQKPVLNEAATISFLQELIATLDTAEVTTTAIAAHLGSNNFSEAASKTLAEDLHTYHLQQGLSDGAINNLQRVLKPSAPQANREYALAILMLRPPHGDRHNLFLIAVSNLLDAEMSIGEKWSAMEIFVKAAQTNPLPRQAKQAIYKAASADPNAAFRVAVWPMVMQDKLEQRDSQRGLHRSLGSTLSKQLIAPVTASTPSFIDADAEVREQAITLLNDYWHPEYPSEYIDILVTLVAMNHSPGSMAKLLELRRIDALNDHQLAALTKIAAQDPAIAQSIKTIIIPDLEAGSLIGPMDVIANSKDSGEWARATLKLLAQYPDGTVPTSVAEAAYSVMARLGEYDVAAVALFTRGDMPFAVREAKVLELVGHSPRYTDNIVKTLQHLHGDVGLDFLVRRYTSDESIDETFRGALLDMLHAEVRESGQMDAETTAAVADFARSADSYFNVATARQMLEATGREVPWSIRIRQQEFQWKLLSWVGLLSLVVGFVAGLYVLVLVALPGRKSRLGGRQRAAGFSLWLLLSVLFIGAVLLSLLHSIGHSSMPRPDRALPYYVATLVISSFLAMLATALRRRRSPEITITESRSI